VQYYKQQRGKVDDHYFTLFEEKEVFDEEELGNKVSAPQVFNRGKRIYYKFEEI